MRDRLHLIPRHRRAVQELLDEHLPGVEVWVYGSRVSGRSHDASDLDLVLRAPGLQPIPMREVAAFTEALRNSNMPYLVDVHDWVRLPDVFQREIERKHVVLVEGRAEG